MRGAGGRRVRRRDRGRRAWLWFWVSAVVVVFVAASFASLARARVPGRGGGVVVVLAVPQGASAGGLARLSGSTRGFAGGSAVRGGRVVAVSQSRRLHVKVTKSIVAGIVVHAVVLDPSVVGSVPSPGQP